jgi:hypothetical protein
MKKKTFDCVEMKHRGAASVQERVAGMSAEQELEFWRQQTEELRCEQDHIRKTLRSQPTPLPVDRST